MCKILYLKNSFYIFKINNTSHEKNDKSHYPCAKTHHKKCVHEKFWCFKNTHNSWKKLQITQLVNQRVFLKNLSNELAQVVKKTIYVNHKTILFSKYTIWIYNKSHYQCVKLGKNAIFPSHLQIKHKKVKKIYTSYKLCLFSHS